MSDTKDNIPPLANLVSAGAEQSEATRVADGIFMVKDISNAYLVTTADGDLMINTGFVTSAEKNKALFATHRTGRLKYIILTQAHADHYGGVPVFRENGTNIVAGQGFMETQAFFEKLGPFLKRRSGKLWAHITRAGGPPPDVPFIEPDILVSDVHRLDEGALKVEVHKVPGGESIDSTIVWLPDQRTLFTGNLFGPVFGACPNLITMRGDKPRSVTEYLASIDYVLELEPELLITGHGEPVRGAEINQTLRKMHRAVSHVNEAVIDGMNEGRSVYELMATIEWPDDAILPEYHGKLPWIVRGIWESYAGWMHYEDGTAMLYPVPRRAVDADVVALAGADPLVDRALAYLDSSDDVAAIHLTDMVLNIDGGHAGAKWVRKAALQSLMQKSGGTNLSEAMWLRSELAALEDI